LCRPKATEKGIQIEVSVDPELEALWVVSDRTRLSQVSVGLHSWFVIQRGHEHTRIGN